MSFVTNSRWDGRTSLHSCCLELCSITVISDDDDDDISDDD